MTETPCLERDPPAWTEIPWTETSPPFTETPLDRDPPIQRHLPGQAPPGQRPPMDREPPRQRPPMDGEPPGQRPPSGQRRLPPTPTPPG